MKTDSSNPDRPIPWTSLRLLQRLSPLRRLLATSLVAKAREDEFLHTPEDKAAGRGVKGMVYGVYHRQSYDGRWVLAGQFRSPQRADALIFDMTVAAIRDGFDLSMLTIVRIDLQIPYGKAPRSLTAVGSTDSVIQEPILLPHGKEDRTDDSD